MKRGLFLVAFLFCAGSAQATLIPTVRLTNWTPGNANGVGVPGGIPTTQTMYVNAVTGALGAGGTYAGTLAAGDGTTDDRAAIQAMLDSCPSGKYVYLPPSKTYKIDYTLNITVSGTSLKGGGETTVIESGTSPAIVVGNGGAFALASGQTKADTVVTNTALLVKGGTTLEIGSTAHFSANQMVIISPRNDASVPVLATDGRENAVTQTVKIVSIDSGTSFTFTPALHYDMGAGATEVTVVGAQLAFTSGIGVESLTLDGTVRGPLTYGISLSQTYGSWVKGVRLKGIFHYGVSFSSAAMCEVRDSRVDERSGGGSSGGAVLTSYSTGILIENNRFPYAPALMAQDGNMAIAFSRNYCAAGSPINTNHGPLNMFILIEGNVGKAGVQDDGYFGGSRYLTVFNNSLQYAILNRGAYDANLVGNFLVDASTKAAEYFGFPLMSAGTYYVGTVTPPTTLWQDFGMTGTLTTRTNDDQGIITLSGTQSVNAVGSGNDFVWLYWNDYGTNERYLRGTVTSTTVELLRDNPYAPNEVPLPAQGTTVKIGIGPLEFVERDLAVEARLTRKGNRWGDNVFDSLGGDTLPESLMYSAKPQWLIDEETALSATFNLQPFDPVTPVAASDSNIPAGYRYLLLEPPTHQGVTISSSGTEASITFNKPLTIGAGGSGGFTTDGNVTWTYNRTVGSTAIFTSNRTIGDEETLVAAYAQPGNGFEDSNGNDLPSFSSFDVDNASQQSAGSYWVQVVALADATNTTNLSNVAAIIQPITIPAAGYVNKIRLGVGAGAYTPNIPTKVALLDASGNVLSSGTGSVSASEDYATIAISPVHVTAGAYSIAVFANSNAEPPAAYLGGQPANSAYYSFGTYASWPGSTVTADGGSAVKYAVGLRLAPDAIPPTFRVKRGAIRRR